MRVGGPDTRNTSKVFASEKALYRECQAMSLVRKLAERGT